MQSGEERKQQQRAAIMATLQEQLDSDECPQVKEHYQRLLLLGFTDEATRELLASVLATYLWHLMRKDDFSHDDFLAQLALLPKLPWAN